LYIKMIQALLCLILFIGSPQLLTAAPAESDLFAEAESRYLGKNYTAALEAYDSFLAVYPLSERVSDVQYRRAVCLYRLARHREAVQLIGEIEVRYRSTRYFTYVPLWKGLSQYALGSFSLCVASLTEFLSGPPDPEFTPQALLHKALAQEALSDDAGALESLKSLADGYPSSRLFPYAAVLRGSILQKTKSYADLLALTQAVDAGGFPEPWKSQYLLLSAEALWFSNRGDEAQPLYIQLTGAPDEVALVAYGRRFAHAQRRGDLQAMRDLTQAAEARFSGRTVLLSDLWTRVGAESFRRGDLDAADSFLRRAWAVRAEVPVNDVVPLYLAEILLSRKDPPAARQVLLDSLSDGKSATGAVIIRLGDLALMADDFPTAAGWYTRFRAEFPGARRVSEAGYMLAYCLFRQGKGEEAARLVNELLRQDADPALRQQLARLQIVLFNSAHRTAEAALALEAYVARYPTDLRSRLDYLKALFVLKRNAAIIQEADAVRRQFPGIDAQDPYASIVVSYLRGLALITAKNYAGAVADLASIKPEAAQKAGLSVIIPYARYYLGWGYLRLSDFGSAASVFDGLAAAYPGHELSPMVVYLAGWTHFSRGEYAQAAAWFEAAARGEKGSELARKSRYLYAKSLLNQKMRDEALTVLLAITAESPPSPWAADALFDYAGALSEKGQTRQAAEAYLSLTERFPDSPLREEAVYRRAETYFTHGEWSNARAAFDEYRTGYPAGRLVDAALYWSGQAAQSLGEPTGAALLWEQLIAGFATSSFRGPALRQTAEVYAQARKYAKALELYNRYAAEYPDEARAMRADIRVEQLRLLAGGEGDREAELSALVARETGDARRKATLELAQLYIYSGDKRAEAGYRMLLPLVKEGAPQAAPQAQILIGEYFYRKGDLMEAARQFLATALLSKVDAATAASALYRAAEMMDLAKKPDEVAAIVKRLETGFPDSAWTAKARLLEGGAQ
jgi:TolA-binding protein